MTPALTTLTWLAALVGQSPAASTSAFDAALRCRAYAPVMRSVLAGMKVPAGGDLASDVEAYWTARSEALGKAAGFDSAAIEVKTLVIPIRAEEADATLSKCLEGWAARAK